MAPSEGSYAAKTGNPERSSSSSPEMVCSLNSMQRVSTLPSPNWITNPARLFPWALDDREDANPKTMAKQRIDMVRYFFIADIDFF
jgi:hypothetical protein